MKNHRIELLVSLLLTLVCLGCSTAPEVAVCPQQSADHQQLYNLQTPTITSVFTTGPTSFVAEQPSRPAALTRPQAYMLPPCAPKFAPPSCDCAGCRQSTNLRTASVSHTLYRRMQGGHRMGKALIEGWQA